MALVRYEPFSLLDRFQRELNRLGAWDVLGSDGVGEDTSNVVTSHWRPAVDLKEENDRFVILADLPGVDPKDIEITMENGTLAIRGERREEKDEDREGFHRTERVRGTFYRRFSLPDTADAERIQAKGKDGVLEIVIPKHEKVQPRKIDVQS
ncbi:MAG: Hsp20/alpha crystallin family protein [Gammaproteobacteria bacterium]|nr:Hsp20/alpha crystallin family protein [Gammaproteobacteria bacterium]